MSMTPSPSTSVWPCPAMTAASSCRSNTASDEARQSLWGSRARERITVAPRGHCARSSTAHRRGSLRRGISFRCRVGVATQRCERVVDLFAYHPAVVCVDAAEDLHCKLTLMVRELVPHRPHVRLCEWQPRCKVAVMECAFEQRVGAFFCGDSFGDSTGSTEVLSFVSPAAKNQMRPHGARRRSQSDKRHGCRSNTVVESAIGGQGGCSYALSAKLKKAVDSCPCPSVSCLLSL